MAFKSRRNFRGNNNNNGAQTTRKETTSEAVSNREFVVVCADKNGRVGTFAENDKYVESFTKYTNDTKLNMFEQLRDVLETIPCHCDELLEKQVAIYVPSAISGNLGDMYRSDKYESCQEIMLDIQGMLFERSLNCFIVDIKGSNATIVQHAYEFVQEETKKANAKADGVEYVSNKRTANKTTGNAIQDKLDEIEIKIADAIIAGDTELEARLESAKARLMSKAPVKTAEEKPEQVDEFANVEM